MCKHNEVTIYVKEDDTAVAVCKECGEERPANTLEEMGDFAPTEAEMKGE